EKAQVHHAAWRRCCVAARGARAASGDADCRACQQPVVRRLRPPRSRVRQRSRRNRLRRRPERVRSANEATLAAKHAATKIPIVMMNVSDPLAQGIVVRLAHLGGNITGLVQDDSAEITAKRMQLLKDAVPHSTQVAVLLNPDVPYGQAQWQQLELAARSLNVKLRRLEMRRANEIESVFAAIGQSRPDAIFLANTELIFVNRQE